MYICMCNPFSDKTVDKYFDLHKGRKVTVAETYRACSGGEAPQCCTCLTTLQAMVHAHNYRYKTLRPVDDKIVVRKKTSRDTA